MGLPPFNWMNRLAGALRLLGLYGVIGLVVPGGSLVVLSLWAFRHRSSLATWARHAFARRTHASFRKNPDIRLKSFS
jgi:HAMP domain-containing protein